MSNASEVRRADRSMSHDATLKSLQEGYCGLCSRPLLIPDLSYLRNAEHREILVSGLRLAAGEP
jgi:hypothetical protein